MQNAEQIQLYREARREGWSPRSIAHLLRPPVATWEVTAYLPEGGERGTFVHLGTPFEYEIRECFFCGCEDALIAHGTYGEDVEAAGMVTMSQEEFDRTEHRSVGVRLAGTEHFEWLVGVCAPTNTRVERVADERYIAEALVEQADEALFAHKVATVGEAQLDLF